MRRVWRWSISFVVFVGFVAGNWFVGSWIAESRSEPAETIECLGAADANHAVVYLHGLDSLGPSWQELENRRILARLAEQSDLRIALPRSRCGSGRCWLQSSDAERTMTRALIDAAADHCFDGGHSYGLVGFSNGGFAIARLLEHAELENVDWVILSGAGGYHDSTHELSRSGKVGIVVGNRDRYHREPSQRYFAWLQERGVDVAYVEFSGGHRLDLGGLSKALTHVRQGTGE